MVKRLEILNQHKRYLKEDTAVDPSVVNNTPTVTSSTVDLAANVIPGADNPKVKELQDLLRTKFSSYIVADSKLGPKTLNSALKALKGEAQDKPKFKVKPKKVKPKVKVDTKVVDKSNPLSQAVDSEIKKSNEYLANSEYKNPEA